VTVLVVETRDDIAEWLQTLLEERGNATVTLLESGRGAAPDAVLERIGRGWVRVGRAEVPLTRREAELIGHLAANRERVVPREELLSRFWGYETRSLDVHLARLRRKLGAAGTAIQTVPGVGYRFIEELFGAQ
jgi:DNA-binding response OmpR family regulator